MYSQLDILYFILIAFVPKALTIYLLRLQYVGNIWEASRCSLPLVIWIRQDCTPICIYIQRYEYIINYVWDKLSATRFCSILSNNFWMKMRVGTNLCRKRSFKEYSRKSIFLNILCLSRWNDGKRKCSISVKLPINSTRAPNWKILFNESRCRLMCIIGPSTVDNRKRNEAISTFCKGEEWTGIVW